MQIECNYRATWTRDILKPINGNKHPRRNPGPSLGGFSAAASIRIGL